MKRGAKPILKSKSFKYTFFVVCLLTVSTVMGQEDNEQVQDSVQTGVELGRILLENPDSIVAKYTYDPKTNQYIYTQSVGDYNVSYPLILTPEQYYDLVKKEEMKAYFKRKADAYAGKKEGSEEDRKNLLPNFYVNSSFFESVFGGNTIEVIPQGSVAMDLGVLWQKNDNPALSPRNRTNLSFDFDQRISLSLLGKVGERLQVTANYDTEATFDFQNLVKLDYTPTEDDIIRKIEIGNVSMPLNSSLITGAQSLFGVKTQLQFGKTTVTAVFSEQRSQTNTVVAQGGGTVNEFSLSALDYDEDRHFFLSHYFRDNYDRALSAYPFIQTQVQITRLEVWVTNRGQITQNVRNVVAIQDLGEALPTNTRIGVNGGNPPGFFNPSAVATELPQNAANLYDPNQIGTTGVLTNAIRDIATVENGFNVPGYPVNQGYDYSILENARKLEAGRDYDFDSQLGYISLSQSLSNDEVLGVAFQYTYNGQVYQVGEFANGSIDATTVSTGTNLVENNSLILKLLKSNITNVQDPIWDLMMKNIYSTGAYQLSQEDFKLNILYSDPTPRNYITPVDPNAGWPEGLEDRILLSVFNLDKLNTYNDIQPGGDGFFDYVEGITVDSQTGRIIFTKVEPFGEFLFNELGGGTYDVEDDQGYNVNQQRYVFRNMYAKTKAASLQDAEKNRFKIQGRYTSQSNNGIPIGAYNVPQGSVTVTAGGRQLQEGIDYTVNYMAGTVQIIDPSLQASDTPINISVENNAIFGQQTRRFAGFNVEHQFNENFVLGGTFLNLNERPLTQKSNYGIEPVNNSIYGLNGNFSTEVPFLTRLANKLPNIDTDVPSNLSVRGEIAFLSPNSPKNADFQGETTTYLDDFEGAQALIDIRSSLGWTLASPPVEFINDRTGIDVGNERAKLAWYTIDPIFYTNQRPAGMSDNDISLNSTRRVFIDEVFTETDIAQGQTQVQSTLDIVYYPNNKGPYNANPSFENETPDSKWAGIMRPLSSTNFEQSNVEFVQFWVLDPYIDGETTDANAGELVLNLGNISEDILKDGRKQYENGLPSSTSTEVPRETIWGQVPSTQSLVYAFDADETNRTLQDIGLDGLDDAAEAAIYNGPANDPALDNYQYYLNRDGGVLERYFDFNNTQGNSPVAVTDTNRGSTTLPDVEDIDRDLTMNTVNSYYEYRIEIKPNTTIDDKYVTDIREGQTPSLPNGTQLNRRWIQYKIPLSDFTDAVGGISDFRSISFMRMYLTGFSDDVVLRFATLDLVRGDWRTYTSSLQPDVDNDPTDDATVIDVNTVNIEENYGRTPIPYVLPPGVIREQLNNNNTIIRQNEQSLSIRIENLESEDSRGVFKNVNIDMRQYERIKMFLHAEKIFNSDYADSDTPLVGFLRLGTDFKENFYQIELPLQFTPYGSSTADEIWPDVNQLEVDMGDLRKVKSKGISDDTLSEIIFYEIVNGEPVLVDEFAPRTPGTIRIGIRGNPSLGSIRGMMLGVKNIDDVAARAEVWFNELRLAGLENNGGWAAIVSMDANMADFANVTATGSKSTSGFGSIDQSPTQRALEDAVSYDVVTNVNVGQLFPKKWNLQLPFNYGISETLITPEYDPVYDDLKLEDRISTATTDEEAEAIQEQAEDYTKRTSINLIGVRKNRGEEAEENFFDIENFTFNYSYNETDHRDFEVAELRDQNVKTGVVYNHNFRPAPIAPFAKKDSMLTGKYWQWLKDLNFNALPTSFSFNANYNRSFNQQRFRDVLEPGVDALELPLLQQRNYLFNWQYALNYSITKSLRLNLTTSNNNIVRNYFNVDDDADSGINQMLDLWDGFFDIGEPNRHAQQMQLNYELPFDKFPFLNFINAQYTYTSNFDWQRGGDALIEVAGENINTVQNANTHNLTANLSMQRFYDFLGLKKRDGKVLANQAPVRRDKAGNPAGGQEESAPKKTSKGFNTLVDIVTMVKRVNVNYSENNGTVLPGYTQSVGFIGTTRPTLGFVFGSQADVRFEAARNGWLTNYQEYSNQYIRNTNKQLNITATAQPTQDITIDLTTDRMYNSSSQETYSPDLWANGVDGLINEMGNFSISTMMISTIFNKSDEFDSKTFEEFKQNRIIIANRLVNDRGGTVGDLDEDGFPERYGKTQQEVLLPAFFAAYTGQDANRVNLDAFREIPIPNWNIKYTGLMKNRWFKEKFTRFSLSHGYRAAYSVNQFQTNLERQNTNFDPETGDLLPEMLINNVVLTDEFSPLIRMDFEMRNSFSLLAEVRTDRTLSLSFDNNLMTEINGKEYTVGLGYRFKDVKFVTNIGGEKTRLKGDLNLKADVSLRDNITIIRNLDINNNQITSGQRLMSIKFTADYALSKSLNALFFYDHSFSEFKVSTAFPQTTINTGFTLRYNFGN
ncbi:T9SS outer membrane translocon Sov/SprA [Flagellimonas zhangzhouensis]|uniref:Protein involved in gliding motility SprA n=1 Tax=Flagellimonas zhangzhouensis TaxID=1073328 RepID=A0A1H2X014_9FLAO|nr:cell surface protein SprA [Allomuricauda zhangzhouensis]SDQ26471.1 protein involved in gliding motility SprA [Allomuricauda zhangzhouensis]SDW86118.1 protein involved in gliding motility SprA [Allomuricauda zhangzhouensis]